MLLIVEIGLFLGGIYVVVTGKIPSLLIDGRTYHVTNRVARVLGVLLMLPMLTAFFGGILMANFYPDQAAENVFALEFITLFVVVILVLLLLRIFGRKSAITDDVETKISKKTSGALMYALFSWTGFGAILCCPLAIINANQALKLMDEHNVGENYRKKAKLARTMAMGSLVLIVVCSAFILFPIDL